MNSTDSNTIKQCRVSPFGNPGIITSGYRLLQAYRRFPRPSSAPVAKASTLRPKKLTHSKLSSNEHKEKTTTQTQPKDCIQNGCFNLDQTTTNQTEGHGLKKSQNKDARVHYTVLKQQPHPRKPATKPATSQQKQSAKKKQNSLLHAPTVCQHPRTTRPTTTRIPTPKRARTNSHDQPRKNRDILLIFHP